VSWEEALRREILEPLGMHRTTGGPVAPYAQGWAVHPWADVVVREPAEDLGLMAPAGQLWSTAADLLRFAAFLAEQGQALEDHALWCALAEVHGPDWHSWPEPLRDPRSPGTGGIRGGHRGGGG
uniref:4-alpha-glucanotransferase n=1 Tax=Streptomyces sp. NRRL WC-3725 TaxID=1463933 RepID=UPI0004C6B9C3